jgi:acyl transferase domain-containing protein
VRANLARQITTRIEFGKQILAMYERGARVFVDAGPGSVLSGLVRQNLEGRPFHVVTLDTRDGELRGMLEGIARLACLGFSVTEKPFFEMRGARVRTGNPSTHRDIWKLDGGGCRPEQQWNEPPARVDRSGDATPAPTNIAARSAPPVHKEDAMKRESAADLVRMYLENMRALGKQQHEIMLRCFGAATGIDESPPLGPAEAFPSPAAVSSPVGHGASVNGRTNGAAHRAPHYLDFKPEGRSETPAQAASASQTAQVPDERDLLAGIRKIVANETGYPEEMLQADTDLEAELGIDSIKRLEITVAACDWAGIEIVDGSKGAAQVARGFKTLAAMVDWVKKKRALLNEVPVRP